MKEIYYTYNNEAIASCIFLAILNNVNEFEIARSCLVLPFLLDDRTVSYLFKNKNIETDLEQVIGEQSRLFVSFNKRYLTLLPVTINSLMILSKSNQINIGVQISIIDNLIFDIQNLGERFKKIEEVIPKFLSLTEKYTTSQLYKMLKIQL
jgi:hypothetical protein